MSAHRPVSTNVTWHRGRLSNPARVARQGHRGVCVWLTGLSGAGKSSIAVALEHHLFERGVRTFVLDGDNLRHGLCGDLGFSPNDRRENIRRVAEVARLFVDAGVVVMAALISPSAVYRAQARAIVGAERFVEVWVKCPLAVCEKRDPKGLYARARAGEITQFTGIDAPYDEPQHADLIVNTAHDCSPDLSAASIFNMLHARTLLDVGQGPALELEAPG